MDRNASEVKHMDKMLLKYSPYKNMENEADKEENLQALMASNGENFSVAKGSSNKKKSNMRGISFGNSMSLMRTHSLDASPSAKNKSRKSLNAGAATPSKKTNASNNNRPEVEIFEGLIEGNN